MIKKVLIAIISILLIALLAVKAKELLQKRVKEKVEEPTPKSMPISIELFSPKKGSLSQKITALAELKSDKEVVITTKLTGFIKRISVEEAQKFNRGDILVEIDSKEIESSIKSLSSSLKARESSLSYAKEVYKRNLNLYSVGGVSKEMLDKSMIEFKNQEALLESVKEQIEQLKVKLSYLNIKAPFNGIVDRVLLNVGDMAIAGKPILKISNSTQKLIFSFNPSQMDLIKKGEKVYLKGNNKAIGKIKSIYTSSTSGLAQAEISLFNRLNMPTGVNLTIEIETQSREGCILSSDTILEKSDGMYIFIYKDSRFVSKRIKPIIESEGKILIENCPEYPLARASKSRLTALPSYRSVTILKVER